MEPLRINARLCLPADELQVSFSRSSGPGGQNVNKVETQVELRFCIERSNTLGEIRKQRLRKSLTSRISSSGDLIVVANSHRERGRNIEEARKRLATLIRGGLQIQKPRKPTKPTRASKRRRLTDKRRRGDLKRSRGQAGE